MSLTNAQKQFNYRRRKRIKFILESSSEVHAVFESFMTLGREDRKAFMVICRQASDSVVK